MRGSIEQSGNIASTMKDSNHLNAVGSWPVKNDAVAHREATEIERKVSSFSAQFRRSGQKLALFVNGIKPTISGFGILLGDSKCDFDEIEICPTGSQYGRHQLRFLFNRLRTSLLMALISRGARSPRLASSMPMATSRRSSSWRKRCRSLDSPSQQYNSQRSSVESDSVADFTSATLLMGKRYRKN